MCEGTGVSISKAEESLIPKCSHKELLGAQREKGKKKKKVCILFSRIPTKTKPGFSVYSLVLISSPHSVLPRWPGALFLHSAEDTEHYSTDELIFMLLFLKPKAGGIR